VPTALWVVTYCLLALPGLARAQQIEVDFSQVTGSIRPLNGVNDGPLVTRGAFDLSPYYADLGIKHIRLHDVPWTYENAVDINYVFPRFEADADDPQSYDFSLTDYYLESIRALGAEVTFRLGYSAEWKYHPPIHNAPPQDFAKWAEVSAHIVRHYNQGWANGRHYNIKYWEIWNEPDGASFWSGTPEEYFNLYEVTARKLKSLDPSLRVGGPTLAYRLEFLEGFLKHCAEHHVPLDFVPWHIYAAAPREVVSRANGVQNLLAKYGFAQVESVLDEWNYFPGDWRRQEEEAKYRHELFADRMGGAEGASFDAAVLVALQDTTVAVADFYQGTNMFWGGLFDEYGVPYKPYFTFKAFRLLLATPERVKVTGSGLGGIAVLAGLSRRKQEATILLSNFGTRQDHYDLALRGLPWSGPLVCDQYRVDRRHDLDLVQSQQLSSTTLVVPGVEVPSVCLLRLRTSP
jgi:hypothetical protein